MPRSILSFSALRAHQQRSGRALSTPHRNGGSPLRSRVVDPIEDHQVVLERIGALLDCLAELPLSVWLEIGRSVVADRTGLESREAARAILDARIVERHLGVPAWYARDAVRTAAFLASQSATGLLRSDLEIFAASHHAAEGAVLAMIARAHLPTAAFETLCAPFAEQISANDSRSD